MNEQEIKFTLRVYDGPDELSKQDAELINKAKAVLKHAYAPYSKFKVAAAILLANGEMVTGTNQENAAFPAGICAEGTALGVAASLHPDAVIKKIAITVKSGTHVVDHPVAPCGICRQKLLECETRSNSDIEIIMMGEEGAVHVVKTVKHLLPLNFSKAEL